MDRYNKATIFLLCFGVFVTTDVMITRFSLEYIYDDFIYCKNGDVCGIIFSYQDFQVFYSLILTKSMLLYFVIVTIGVKIYEKYLREFLKP